MRTAKNKIPVLLMLFFLGCHLILNREIYARSWTLFIQMIGRLLQIGLF